jgi:hypothetical protein
LVTKSPIHSHSVNEALSKLPPRLYPLIFHFVHRSVDDILLSGQSLCRIELFLIEEAITRQIQESHYHGTPQLQPLVPPQLLHL